MKNKDNILNASLATEFSQKYLAYALSTITHRALPDVRDGLKPVTTAKFRGHGLACRKFEASKNSMADACLPRKSGRCCVLGCTQNSSSSTRPVTGVIELPLRYQATHICDSCRKRNVAALAVLPYVLSVPTHPNCDFRLRARVRHIKRMVLNGE